MGNVGWGEFFGHVQIFGSYSFGHLESVNMVKKGLFEYFQAFFIVFKHVNASNCVLVEINNKPFHLLYEERIVQTN